MTTVEVDLPDSVVQNLDAYAAEEGESREEAGSYCLAVGLDEVTDDAE